LPKLVVEGEGTFQVDAGETLLDLCDALDLDMGSDCGGFAACNACRVKVLEGMENLSPLEEEERPFLDAPDQRLGCQALVTGDVRVAYDPGI